MRLFLDNDTDVIMNFDYEDTARAVIEEALKMLDCPLDLEVSILLTDNETIRIYNRDTRDIDSPTDVLSYPGLEYDRPGAFSTEGVLADCTDPETGLINLGEMIISLDKVVSQAVQYGHSKKREFAFLVAHSILHLCGFDHETEEEAKEMFGLQDEILDHLGITRDISD